MSTFTVSPVSADWSMDFHSYLGFLEMSELKGDQEAAARLNAALVDSEPAAAFAGTTIRASSSPAVLRRSSAMLFLLRLNMGKNPAPAPSRWRVRSPSTGSTLMTSAPRSASTMPQVGPMTMWVNSTTRSPARGKGRDVVPGVDDEAGAAGDEGAEVMGLTIKDTVER